MPFKLLILLSLFLFSFCSSKTEKKSSVTSNEKQNPIDTIRPIEIDSSIIDTIALEIHFTPGTNYNTVKLTSTSLKNNLKNSDDSLKKQALENLILNQLIPYWYGTPWDFNGYTETPKKGVIACGYFVSTVLKHAGFNLDRYKLAQQNPLNEAKSVAVGDSVEIYEVNSSQLQNIFNEKYEEGIYFVGLDFHVGFLIFRNKELYFIHSNYINSKGVVFEKAIYSDAFNAASKYRIAEISTNEKLLGKWVNGEQIKIVSGN
jgi:hypothetical protein